MASVRLPHLLQARHLRPVPGAKLGKTFVPSLLFGSRSIPGAASQKIARGSWCRGCSSRLPQPTFEEKQEIQATTRRQFLWLHLLAFQFLVQAPANAWAPAVIDATKAPRGLVDPSDGRLREAALLFERALEASTVEEEERLWTEIIQRCAKLDADWANDITSRALGNRGNARSRQGRMEEALKDFDESIALAPYAPDPVLNRGVALESLGRFEEAAQDYQAVLAANGDDPAAWNNLGNVRAAQGIWDEALEDYRKAVRLAPEFAFAAANYSLALFQVGRENEAVKLFRGLLRRYPEFPDVRAALAVSLYSAGLLAEAENNWTRVEDGRYKDRNWVRNVRRWPPRLADALESFLDLTPSKA